MTSQDVSAPFWATVATCRQAVAQLLMTRYGWPNADCEDAVSAAAVRTLACLPVNDVQAHLYRVSQRILLHQMRDDSRHGTTHAVLGEALAQSSVNPARHVQAVHDLAYYLSLLRPRVRARLLATIEEPDAVVARQWQQSLSAVKTGNKRARQTLRVARAKEESRLWQV